MKIARQLGHADTRMTERHYAHLSPSYVADAIRAGFPSLGIVVESNIVGLAEGPEQLHDTYRGNFRSADLAVATEHSRPLQPASPGHFSMRLPAASAGQGGGGRGMN